MFDFTDEQKMVRKMLRRWVEAARDLGGKPIAEHQLVQAKLAKMYVHYQNVRNLLFKHLWMSRKGIPMTLG
jgi:alkylation response protein AidB-like acyl-CoA dehydrogenase